MLTWLSEASMYGNELGWVLALIKLELRFAGAPASSVTNLANYYPFMADSAAFPHNLPFNVDAA